MTDTNGVVLTSHTGESGAAPWTRHASYSGDGVITTNRLRLNDAGTASVHYASASPPSVDYEVQADYHCVATTNDGTGLCARINTAADTYYFLHRGSTSWDIFKNVAASYTDLGTYANAASAGVSQNGRLTLIGTSLQAYIDGTLQISVTDSAITAAGQFGPRLDGAGGATANVHLDNLIARPLRVTDRTGQIGATWTLQTSTSGLPDLILVNSANRLRGARVSASIHSASGVPASRDYDVSASVYVASNVNTYFIGPMARISGAQLDGYVVLYTNVDGKWILYRRSSGGLTEIGNFTQALTPGVTYVATVRCRGSNISALIDGVTRITATDATVTAVGLAGIYADIPSVSETTGYQLSNFVATNA